MDGYDFDKVPGPGPYRREWEMARIRHEASKKQSGEQFVMAFQPGYDVQEIGFDLAENGLVNIQVLRQGLGMLPEAEATGQIMAGNPILTPYSPWVVEFLKA